MIFRIAFLTFSIVTAVIPAVFLLPRLGLSRRTRLAVSVFLFAVSSQFLCNILFGGSMFYPSWPPTVVMAWGSLNCALMVFFFMHLPCYLLPRSVGTAYHRMFAAVIALSAIAVTAVGVHESVKAPQVKEVELSFPDLPAAFNGYRIAQLSDVHCSQITPRSRFEDIVKRTNAARADLVCITGDCADGWVENLGGKLEPFAGFAAPDGVLAVAGNHEYYWDWEEWRGFFEKLGVRFLENSQVRIVRGGDSILVTGVPDIDAAKPIKRDSAGNKVRDLESRYPGPNLTVAFAGAADRDFKVLLSHRPQPAFSAGKAYGVRLQLSGHTHGGGLPGMSWIVSKWNAGCVRGLYEYGTRKLYVSPGTGQWAGFPLRIFNPAEITLFTLRRATGDR